MEKKEGTNAKSEGMKAEASTATKEAPKKKTVWSKIGTFLMYGWMLVLIFIIGMIILISSLVQRC